MKRWLFMSVTLILFILSVFFFQDIFIENLFETIILFSSIIFLFIAISLLLNYQQHQKVKTLQNRLSMWTKLSYHVNQVGDEVFNELPIGIIACDEDFEVKWANPYAKTIFDNKITGKTLKEINVQLHHSAISSKMNFQIQVKEDTYDVIYRQQYKFFYIFNVTEKENIKLKYINQIPALAIIYLDNLDETLASLDVSEQSSLKGEYLGVLSDWASQYDAYLKPYDDERLVMFLSRKRLVQMMEDKFAILEKIRQISQQNRVKISLSIGIASWDLSYEELGTYAQNAVELAEKRGGDQVVVNIQNQKIAYFGAKNDATAKSSKVGVRINAQTIRDFIARASNVYIMGHNQSDLDAFGAMLAVYHMAKVEKKDVHIIVDESKLDQTVTQVYQKLKKSMPEIKERVMTSENAKKQIDPETLLIVLDSQSPRVTMSQKLLEKVETIIVIDHHRVNEEGFNATFSYIEPYASSTVELVMELLNFYNIEEEIHLSPLEATIMYGGLLVDTNNFTYRTGARTFEVASRLKELGADTTEVKFWLRRDLNRTLDINRLISKVKVFLDRFAIIVTSDIIEDRVILAQVSEEALEIDGIEAAFTIAMISPSTVGLSARSYNQINVQLIMEAFGGGGHLNSAAAQIENDTIRGVVKKLKQNLEMEYGGGEDMKIILLEDIKGKGKKDDIIDVKNGYGLFLIGQKKAIHGTDENIQLINTQKENAFKEQQRHLELMKKLKSEIDNKTITVPIQIGVDGKLFGAVTTKQLVEAFESAHGILLDKKKVELDGEINSVGIYTATVSLHKDVKAQFEVHIVEK
jgi:cyclic-di-AMP phosphodiesterase